MYNVKSEYTPKTISNLFNQRETSPYNLRRHILPASFKEAVPFNSCKKLIKKCVPQACPCKLCKNYILAIGFVASLP